MSNGQTVDITRAKTEARRQGTGRGVGDGVAGGGGILKNCELNWIEYLKIIRMKHFYR